MGLKEVEDILREVDLNGDGLVDFEGKFSLLTTHLKFSVEFIVILLLSLFTEFVRMMSR